MLPEGAISHKKVIYMVMERRLQSFGFGHKQILEAGYLHTSLAFYIEPIQNPFIEPSVISRQGVPFIGAS